MTALSVHAEEYLRLRRTLGHDLADAHRLLPRFVAYLDAVGAGTVTVEAALNWAQQPDASPGTSVWARRMTVARGFARHMAGIDARTEVPPIGLVTFRQRRRPPFIYSTADIAALMALARGTIPGRLRAATVETLIGLLGATGLRVGQALGLRHADIASQAREIRIVPRADNANDARAKCRSVHTIPVTASLVRLYSEYLFVEYGDLDCDYVFVNLWGRPFGHPLRYQAVAGLVARLRARTGIDFHLHLFRHSHATDLIRQGVPIEIVAERLTHSSVVTTSQTYLHLSAADVAAGLVRAGVWPQSEARS